MTRFRWLCLCLLVLSAACSMAGFSYELAPRIATRFVDDYLQLNNRQTERALELFRERHAVHARDELPRYYRFITDIERATADGITADEVITAFDGVEQLYSLGVERTIPAAAQILADLDSDQLDALEERLREDVEEDRERLRENHKARRLKEALEDVEDWLGDVHDAQRELVHNALRTMDETRPLWLEWRIARNEKLIALLRASPARDEIEDFLHGYWVRRDGMPPDLLNGVQANRERYVAMIVALDASLTAKQRAHAQKKLAEYRETIIDMMPDEIRVAVLEAAEGTQRIRQ